MSNADWYPVILSLRLPWHANFAVQAAASGTAHGLTAGQVTQIGIDATNVALIVNGQEAADDFRQAYTEWKNLVLEGDLGIAMPANVTPPTVVAPGIGSLPSIEARTRQYAALIRASVGITQAVLEQYGLVAPAGGGPGTPGVRSATAIPGGGVSLALTKAGYDVLAIDMRVGGGAWVQVGISQTATFVDPTPAVVPGAPEQREYRCQGMVANARVGALSAIVSVVTVP